MRFGEQSMLKDMVTLASHMTSLEKTPARILRAGHLLAAYQPQYSYRPMSEAFAAACKALRIFAGDEHGREAVTARVIELTCSGMTEPAVIVQRSLRRRRW
jgi:hypothetical protein